MVADRAAHLPPGKRGNGKRKAHLREVVNSLMYVLSTGCRWRDPQGFAAQEHGLRLFRFLGPMSARLIASTTRFT
jgi:transposase